MRILYFLVFLLTILFINNQDIAEDETKELINKFNQIDINQDGYIVFSEIKNAYDGNIDDFEIDRFFLKYDTDKDGKLSVNEYLNKKFDL